MVRLWKRLFADQSAAPFESPEGAIRDPLGLAVKRTLDLPTALPTFVPRFWQDLEDSARCEHMLVAQQLNSGSHPKEAVLGVRDYLVRLNTFATGAAGQQQEEAASWKRAFDAAGNASELLTAHEQHWRRFSGWLQHHIRCSLMPALQPLKHYRGNTLALWLKDLDVDAALKVVHQRNLGNIDQWIGRGRFAMTHPDGDSFARFAQPDAMKCIKGPR